MKAFFNFFCFKWFQKNAKLYSNGVKTAIFCKKSQTSHKMTSWSRTTAAYPQTLVCDMFSCTSLLSVLLKSDVFHQVFLKLGFKPPFSSPKFSLRRSIFVQINDCHIFEVETQNRTIRKPHFLLNLSLKQKNNNKKHVHSLQKNCNFLRRGEAK